VQGKIAKLQAGAECTFVLTEQGLLYGWGSGTGADNKINQIKI
jgi:alpha-tubulin suppressor-like RCC1 family protein